MPCPILPSFGAYALGTLDQPDHADVAQHLLHCAACRTEAADLIRCTAILRLLSTDDLELVALLSPDDTAAPGRTARPGVPTAYPTRSGSCSVPSVTYRSAFPMLICDDLPQSLAFYRDALGFAETFAFPEDEAPVYVALQLPDGSHIGLGAVAPDGKGYHGQTQRPVTGHSFELCIYTDDVDRAAADLRRRGYTILRGPSDTEWGERISFVADPDGNPVMLTASSE